MGEPILFELSRLVGDLIARRSNDPESTVTELLSALYAIQARVVRLEGRNVVQYVATLLVVSVGKDEERALGAVREVVATLRAGREQREAEERLGASVLAAMGKPS